MRLVPNFVLKGLCLLLDNVTMCLGIVQCREVGITRFLLVDCIVYIVLFQSGLCPKVEILLAKKLHSACHQLENAAYWTRILCSILYLIQRKDYSSNIVFVVEKMELLIQLQNAGWSADESKMSIMKFYEIDIEKIYAVIYSI